ncbi:MAG: squalene/phytoene synthase family protein [Planctomycetes bacterium]|nr:squalene/phytoene synthase family protein [Planctomycetota bacterium]
MTEKLDYRHAQRFATRQARQIAGELYPGPVLMPRGMLRALDPVLAVAMGPARQRREAFRIALRNTLRGRPDGPLMLALWSSATSGEIDHGLVLELMDRMPEPMPEAPKSREELLDEMRPRVELVARWALGLAQRDQPEAAHPASQLGCGLVLTRLLTDLPQHLSAGKIPLPTADLETAGATLEDLVAGVRTPVVNRYLSSQVAWTRELLDEGLPVCDAVGSRLARGLRAAVLRARHLLDLVDDPRCDLFRRRPSLSHAVRLRCAVRAWWPVRPESEKE